MIRRSRRGGRFALIGSALAASAAVGAGAEAAHTPQSLDPPEIAANAATGWPEHNYDLDNTRDDTSTQIDAENVATLEQKWAFKLSFHGEYGARRRESTRSRR